MSIPTNLQGDSSGTSLLDPASQGRPPFEQEAAGPKTVDRRSEKTAVRRIAAFFIFLTLCFFGFHHLIQFGIRRIETGGFGVTNRIVSGRVNAEIVISGSSRALNHYDSRIIQEITGHSTFNIGRNGSQTDMQVAFLKSYLQYNTPPKLVVHNLDLFSFVTSREIYDPAQYMPYLHNDAIYEGIRRVYPDVWKWKYLPLYGYVVEDMRFTWLRGLNRLAGIQPREDHFQGYLPRHTSWTGDFEKFRASNPDGVRFEIEPQGVRDVEELMEVCQQQGIALLLVYSPEYDQMQAITRNRADIFTRFREISSHFQSLLWDFSDSPICRNRANFYNSQHLNAKGAASFSRVFAQRLLDEDLLGANVLPKNNGR